jgi:hypothetical protein
MAAAAKHGKLDKKTWAKRLTEAVAEQSLSTYARARADMQRSLTKAKELRAAYLTKFAEDQPRDEWGRWTSVGGEGVRVHGAAGDQGEEMRITTEDGRDLEIVERKPGESVEAFVKRLNAAAQDGKTAIGAEPQKKRV